MKKRLLVGVMATIAPLLPIAGLANPEYPVPTTDPRAGAIERYVSVRLIGVPLVDALESILEQTGAELTVLGSVDGQVTAEFDSVPLEQVLRRLLQPPISFVLSYPIGGATVSPDGRLRVLMSRTPGPTVSAQAVQPGLQRKVSRAPEPQADGPDLAVLEAVESGGWGRTVAERSQFLAGVLSTGSDASVRSAALKVLASVDPLSIEMIVRAAETDPSPAVRQLALETLVAHVPRAGDRVIETMLAVAANDPDSGVREQARIFASNLDPSRQ